MGSLDGLVAIVTGCGRPRGMGRGIADALAEAGADLTVTDVEKAGRRDLTMEGLDLPDGDWDGLETLVRETSERGRRVLAVLGDVGLEKDAERIVRETVSHFGRVDILVNTAAAPHGADRNFSWEVPADVFEEVWRVNTKGVFLMSTAVARHFLDQKIAGRIINIAAEGAKHGVPKRAAYCSSKFAVLGLTQSMAHELAPYGVIVNAVCPGATSTDRLTSTLSRVSAGQEVERTITAATKTPVGRIGTPSDIGRAVVFFADPAGGYVTGQSLLINGGSYMS